MDDMIFQKKSQEEEEEEDSFNSLRGMLGVVYFWGISNLMRKSGKCGKKEFEKEKRKERVCVKGFTHECQVVIICRSDICEREKVVLFI